MTAESAVTASTMRTRLNHFKPAEINLLLQAGYAGADASLRSENLAENCPAASYRGLPLSH